MIKINLATKKQASYAAGSSKVTGLSGLKGKTGAGFGKIDWDEIKALPLLKVILSIAVIVLVNVYFEDEKKTKLDLWGREIAKLDNQQKKLNSDLEQTRGYEKIREQLIQDEFIIRAKIDTINKLVQNRMDMANMLLALSDSIPKEAWLEEFQVNTTDINFKGLAVDYDNISDFMKRLGGSSYFTSLELKTSAQGRDKTNKTVTLFEIAAKQRKE